MKTLEKIGFAAVATPLVILMLGLAFAYALFTAYVAELVWTWHVRPLASWIPAIGWKAFWALAAIKSLSFGKSPLTEDSTEKDSTKLAAKFVGMFAAPAVVLGIAWWLR